MPSLSQWQVDPAHQSIVERLEKAIDQQAPTTTGRALLTDTLGVIMAQAAMIDGLRNELAKRDKAIVTLKTDGSMDKHKLSVIRDLLNDSTDYED